MLAHLVLTAVSLTAPASASEVEPVERTIELLDEGLESVAMVDPAGADGRGTEIDRAQVTGLPVPVVAAGLGAVVGVAWVSLRRRKRHLDEALDQALVDPLTSVPNRRRLDADIAASSREFRRRVGVLMVDIDHFKQINDRHGHRAGDTVLRGVGSALMAVVRRGDVVYRYGGEEFCILLPGASIAEAEAVAERVRTAVGRVDSPAGTTVTVSIGVTEGPAAATWGSIERADRALYAAKGAGRDRVRIDGAPVA